jgi:hypothetical protein
VSRWLVSVPVFGEYYVDQFCAAALPALQRAVDALRRVRGADVWLVVHTDAPDRVRAATSVTVDARPVPAGLRGFDGMSQAHREVVAEASDGDVIVPLTAGAVMSEQGLVHCAEVLDDPRKLVVLCAVPRVLDEGPVADTADAQALMDWAWAHRHPMVDACTWPRGRSADLSRVYFASADGGTVVTRQALPHPVAVRKDGRAVSFAPTIDANLFLCYSPDEMHATLDCGKLALVKLTPADKGYDLAAQPMEERVRAGKVRVPGGNQAWSVGLRVVLRGGGADCGDGQYVGVVVR